jgi:hypothetical protein
VLVCSEVGAGINLSGAVTAADLSLARRRLGRSVE